MLARFRLLDSEDGILSIVVVHELFGFSAEEIQEDEAANAASALVDRDVSVSGNAGLEQASPFWRGESEKNRGRLQGKLAWHVHAGKIAPCRPANPSFIS
jgi:hypothetical protein